MPNEQHPLQRNNRFKYRFCGDCCLDGSRFCYIFWCSWPAIADVSLISSPFFPCLIPSEHKKKQWLYVFICCAIQLLIFPLLCAINFLEQNWGYFSMFAFFTILPCPATIVYQASTKIAERMEYSKEEYGFCCCLQYYFCLPLKICQIANQLDLDMQGNQSQQCVELITEINEHAMFKNRFCKVKNFAAAAEVEAAASDAEERYETEQQIHVQRRDQVDAAIVRIMKARKQLIHAVLVRDVHDQLATRFDAQIHLIKQRIEAMIELEYLERDPDDRSSYQYKP